MAHPRGDSQSWSTAIRRVGRYAVFRPIAAGGMATVHLGRLMGSVGFTRTVAIKRLHQQYAQDPEFVSMFLDEARLAGRVQHPNVVATFDVVTLDDELFIIMEYVHGDSLSKLMKSAFTRNQASERSEGADKKDKVDPKIASAIICGALHGLHAAHEAKSENGKRLDIVHRDISPQNILVGADGVARVLDFGVAKAVNRIHSTHEGEVKGKFRYMSPEQIKNEAVDRRTDVYATGIVLFELLTGERFVQADDPGAIVFEALTRVPVPPSAKRSDLSPMLDAVVLKALAPKPEDRFASAEEMALALEEATGIASPPRVGRWVSDLAKDTLAERAQCVADVEGSDDARPTSSLPPPLLTPPSSGALPRSRPMRVGETVVAALSVEAPSVASNVTATLTTTPTMGRARGGYLVPLGLGAIVAVLALGTIVAIRSRSVTNAAPLASDSVPSAAPTASEEPPAAIASSEPSAATPVESAGAPVASASTKNKGRSLVRKPGADPDADMFKRRK